MSSLCSDESLYNFHLNTFGPKHSLDCLVFQNGLTGSLNTHDLEFFNGLQYYKGNNKIRGLPP